MERPTFQPKSHEQLGRELGEAEQVLETKFFKFLDRDDEILEKDAEELKRDYPNRYKTYLKLRRSIARERAQNHKALMEVKPEPDAPIEDEEQQELIELSEEQIEKLREDFLGDREFIRFTNNIEFYVDKLKNGQEGELREHQKSVFESLEQFFNKGTHREGRIGMPTGSGKTVVFAKLAQVLAGHRNGLAPLKTLVLVPTIDLVKQTQGIDSEGHATRGFAKFAPELDVSIYYSGEKDLSGDVVVTTYQSYIELMKEWQDQQSGAGRGRESIAPDFADLIICDEAHKALGEKTKEMLEQMSPDAVKIGLTATDEYDETKKVAEIFPELIHQLNLIESVKIGILAQPRGYLHRTRLALENINLKAGDYDEATLAQLNQEQRNRDAVRFAKSFAEQGLQGVVSCLRGSEVAHAKLMAELINEEKIVDSRTGKLRPMVARVVSGEINPSERQEIYSQYEKGNIDYLTFVDALSEGWDSEAAKVLINLRPTRSKVFAKQRLGRILRPNENGDDAIFIEFEDEFADEDKKPYTGFDIFETEDIVQGAPLVSPEHSKKMDVSRAQQLLTELGNETHLTRKPASDGEPHVVGRELMMARDEVHIGRTRIEEDMKLSKEGLSHITGQEGVRSRRDGQTKRDYYSARELAEAMCTLIDDTVERDRKKGNRHHTLRFLSQAFGIKDSYLRTLAHAHGVKRLNFPEPPQTPHYATTEIQELVKNNITSRAEVLQLIGDFLGNPDADDAYFLTQLREIENHNHFDTTVLKDMLQLSDGSADFKNMDPEERNIFLEDMQSAFLQEAETGSKQERKPRHKKSTGPDISPIQLAEAHKAGALEFVPLLEALDRAPTHAGIRDALAAIDAPSSISGADRGSAKTLLEGLRRKYQQFGKISKECERLLETLS